MRKAGISIIVSLLVTSCSDMKDIIFGDKTILRVGEIYYRNLQINNSQLGALTDFPLLIRLDSNRINYSLCGNNGESLAFLDADFKAPLHFEIETWNPAGTSFVWVQKPEIRANSASDSIFLLYGATEGLKSINLSSETWSADYRGVYHMNNGSDSTQFQNHAGVSDILQVNFKKDSELGGAGQFNATGADTPRIRVPINGLSGSGGTIEAVAMAYSLPANSQQRFIFSQRGGGDDRLYLAVKESTGNYMGAVGDRMEYLSPTATFVQNTVTYVAMTFDNAGNLSLYFNGLFAGSSTYTNLSFLTTAAIGNYGAYDSSYYAWDGEIYEFRIISAVRNSDYFAANQLNFTDAYVLYGPEQRY